MCCEFTNGWRSTGCLRQLSGCLTEHHAQFLCAPRDADRPTLIAEVTLDFTDDGGRCETRKLESAFCVETIYRIDQANRAHLNQIFEWLASIAEPSGQKTDE